MNFTSTNRPTRGRGASALRRAALTTALAATISVVGSGVMASVAGANVPTSNLVLWVDVLGTGTTCTESAPCSDLAQAATIANSFVSYIGGGNVTINVGPGSFVTTGSTFNGSITTPTIVITGVPGATTIDLGSATFGIVADCVNLTVEGIQFSGDSTAIKNVCGTTNIENDSFRYLTTGVLSNNNDGSSHVNVTNSLFLGDEAGVSFVSGASGTIDSSTFSQNFYGVNADQALVTITNSTLNYSQGGVYLNSSIATLANDTIDQTGYGIYSKNSTATITATILANSYQDNCYSPTSDTFVDNGFNIDNYGDCNFSSSTGSITGIDPQLGPLQDNGGYTMTQAILSNSVAYQKVPASDCPSVDQRGESRPQPASSSFCDIGAYEYGAPTSIAFITAPITGPTSAGSNLGPVTVQALDAQGFPAVSNHVITLNLATTALTSDFAQTPLGTATSVATIATGANKGKFYFGDFHPTSFPLTVTGWNAHVNLGTLSQTETVVTGPAAIVTNTAGDAQTVQVGQLFPTNLSVNVTDGTLNPVFKEPVTFTVLSGSATFPADSTTATVNTDIFGNATAPALIAGTTPGGVSIGVTTTQAAANSSFSETVLVGPPTTLAINAGSGQSATPTANFITNLQTYLTDQFGNPISGKTIVYDVTSGTAQFSSSATNSQVTDAGGATTAGTLTAGTVAGVQTITATVTGFPLVNVTFSNIVIVPGAADSIVETSGSYQSATSDTTFATPLSVTVLDGWGNPRSGDQVNFAVTSGSANFGFVTSTSALTNSYGLATASSLVAGDHAGTQAITATVFGTALSTSFLAVIVTPPKRTVNISSFLLNSSTLTTGMKIQISAVAATINRFGNTNVALTGYSDVTGTTNENKPLSLARAVAVKTYLLTRLAALGVSGVSITTSGKGATNFIGGNGRSAANRRVTAALS